MQHAYTNIHTRIQVRKGGVEYSELMIDRIDKKNSTANRNLKET